MLVLLVREGGFLGMKLEFICARGCPIPITEEFIELVPKARFRGLVTGIRLIGRCIPICIGVGIMLIGCEDPPN